MIGEDRKNYRGNMSRKWKIIKEDPERLSAYNDRARQMKNEAEEPGDDSQNEKMVVDRLGVKNSKKALKSPEFVNTGPDDTDYEQERQAQKNPDFVDTDSSTEDEQGPAVNYQRYVEMHSTEDEQEPAIKKLQKA